MLVRSDILRDNRNVCRIECFLLRTETVVDQIFQVTTEMFVRSDSLHLERVGNHKFANEIILTSYSHRDKKDQLISPFNQSPKLLSRDVEEGAIIIKTPLGLSVIIIISEQSDE